MTDDVTLEDHFDSIGRRHGDWNSYLTKYFVKLDERQRATELALFNKALHDQAKPTKEFSSYWLVGASSKTLTS